MAQAPSPNFKSMLRKSMDEIKKPEAVPEGTYTGVIKGHELGESTQKKTPYVRFFVVLQGAESGVERDDLETALQGQPISSKKLRKEYYFTEEANYRFKDMATSLGIDTSGRSIEEVINDCEGKTVLVEVGRKPNQEGDTFYNEVGLMRGQDS